MKQIRITRDTNGNVRFDTVSVDTTETVFFTNLDPQAAHWPDLSTNRLGPAPSANSSQCVLPVPAPNPFTYKCRLHAGEQGTINVFEPLASATTALHDATVGQPIAEQQVVSGGKAPYAISGQAFQVTDGNGTIIQSGAGIGPGLSLNARTSDLGITVTGTPTVPGTYTFTFTVNDAMGRNLQQTQYSMTVNAVAT
jgi:hypothetical protein